MGKTIQRGVERVVYIHCKECMHACKRERRDSEHEDDGYFLQEAWKK